MLECWNGLKTGLHHDKKLYNIGIKMEKIAMTNNKKIMVVDQLGEEKQLKLKYKLNLM